MVTPLGNNAGDTWSGLMAGRSGAGPITRFDARDFSVRFACEVKGFEPLDYVDKEEFERVGLFTLYAFAASDEALADSGLKINSGNTERIGTYISASIGDFTALEVARIRFLKEGPASIPPHLMPTIFAYGPSQAVRRRRHLKGPAFGVATACAAGNHAIGDSFKMIQRGDLDAMICGGTETPVAGMIVGGFASMRALSTRNDAPESASRPFDRDRDGFVVGEGSGIIILEELEHARSRGARIYAEMVGYGSTADASHITMPDPMQRGTTRVMRAAMEDAGVAPEQVAYINAHGTSTPPGDRGETLAVKKVFGEHSARLAISSTKSMTGHLLGAAGGIEAAFTVLAIHHGKVPPTINYTTQDPVCDLDYVPNRARELAIEYALSNGFGFGGTNTALLFKRYEQQGN